MCRYFSVFLYRAIIQFLDNSLTKVNPYPNTIGSIIAMTFTTAVVNGSSLAFAIVVVQSHPAFAIVIVQSPLAIVFVCCRHCHGGSKES